MAMGGEGFATRTDSRVAEALQKSVGPGFELGRWSFFSCHLVPEISCSLCTSRCAKGVDTVQVANTIVM